MLARVTSYLLVGIDAQPCEVEVDCNPDGFPTEKRTPAIVVGLPDTSVKESIERVRAAVDHSGFRFPVTQIVINLAPADVRKEGAVYDLPIAVGVLMTTGQLPSGARAPGAPNRDQAELLDPRSLFFAGELALDGRVRPVKGAIALAALAKQRGYRGVVIPADNADEAAVVPGMEVYGVRTLAEVVGLLRGDLDLPPRPTPDVASLLSTAPAPIDFAEVRGQEAVKRALMIAAAGGHNLVMLGPAGTGKSMMAKALPGILPPLTVDEALEVTRVYSAAGALPPGQSLITTRPVRAPHHTASSPAIVGGGMVPRPGEVSLAHHGVLFLDELPEFPRYVLETLRQPLEDHVVTIARAHGAVRFPTSIMLVAAMNPTPKGDIAPGEVGRRAMEQYLSRLSGPLLDRIDMHVEAPAVPWKQLSEAPRGTSSEAMRAQVLAARARQLKRQGEKTPNARLSGRQLDELAPLDEPSRTLLGNALSELGLSARAYDKIRRVARTIADIDAQDAVSMAHVSEAVGYRLLDRRV